MSHYKISSKTSSWDHVSNPESSELGKKSEYDAHYNPDKLFAIPRKLKRDEIGVTDPLPFSGYDVWNHYEVSWLNQKGKPVAAIAEIIYSCDTPRIIESKSMKLYFNSLNNTRFEDADTVQKTIANDIAERVGGVVIVNIKTLPLEQDDVLNANPAGYCLDHLDIECFVYEVKPDILFVEDREAEEVVYSNLLKSNCLVTNQPDWGSVEIRYRGRQINHENLLKYIVSFRNHNEFHEQCIERIFVDITRYCKPASLTVIGRYTRRGGVDINPFRTSDFNIGPIVNKRLCRQ